MTMSRDVPLIYSEAMTDVLFYPDKYTTPEWPRKPQASLRVGKPDPSMEGAIPWSLTLEDTRGGLNLFQGDLDETYDRVQSSTLNTEHYRHLTLPLLTTNATTPDPGSGSFLSWADVFNVAAVGIGGTANSSLFAETSATNPAIVAKTYSPGSTINALVPIIINGTPSYQLAVLREGGAIQILSDLGATPTIVGTMHADTTQAYGLVQMPTPEWKLIIYAGGKLRMMRGTDAIAREPDDVLQSVPNYGYALGTIVRSIGFSGKKVRPFFVFPRSTTLSQHMLTKGSESPGYIVHTDENGMNPQKLDLPITNIYFAAIIRNGVLASDGERIVYHDGQTVTNIKRNDDRGYSSDLQLRIRGMWVRDPDVFCEIELQASPSGSAATVRWIERYNFDTQSWHQVSGTTTLSTTGALGLASASGSMPISRTTNNLHIYSDGSWRRIYQPYYGMNPYALRQIDPGGTGNTQETEPTGTYFSPKWELTGLEGMPKLVTRILCLGDIDAGGTGASITVTAGNMSAPFLTGLADRSQEAEMSDNGDLFYKLQVSVTLNRTSGSTRYNMNGFPIIIEGYAYPDDNQESSSFGYDPR